MIHNDGRKKRFPPGSRGAVMKRFLIIVDVQNDFCPGGSLAVADGASIIPVINGLSTSGKFDVVIATQDWHPAGHVSFASTHGKHPFEAIALPYGGQTLWPDHCVQGTHGADFHADLDLKPVQFIIRKGYRKEIDSYSAFFENDKITATGLGSLVKGISGDDGAELFIAGIATDVCVFNTAVDARRILGFRNVSVVSDACAGVDDAGSARALSTMGHESITITGAADLLK